MPQRHKFWNVNWQQIYWFKQSFMWIKENFYFPIKSVFARTHLVSNRQWKLWFFFQSVLSSNLMWSFWNERPFDCVLVFFFIIRSMIVNKSRHWIQFYWQYKGFASIERIAFNHVQLNSLVKRFSFFRLVDVSTLFSNGLKTKHASIRIERFVMFDTTRISTWEKKIQQRIMRTFSRITFYSLLLWRHAIWRATKYKLP